jgi:hypothetical protein
MHIARYISPTIALRHGLTEHGWIVTEVNVPALPQDMRDFLAGVCSDKRPDATAPAADLFVVRPIPAGTTGAALDDCLPLLDAVRAALNANDQAAKRSEADARRLEALAAAREAEHQKRVQEQSRWVLSQTIDELLSQPSGPGQSVLYNYAVGRNLYAPQGLNYRCDTMSREAEEHCKAACIEGARRVAEAKEKAEHSRHGARRDILTMYGTGTQLKRFEAGVLPESELADVVRGVVFDRIEHWPRYEKITKADVGLSDDDHLDVTVEEAEELTDHEWKKLQELRAQLAGPSTICAAYAVEVSVQAQVHSACGPGDGYETAEVSRKAAHVTVVVPAADIRVSRVLAL